MNLQSILNKAVNRSGSNPPGRYSVCHTESLAPISCPRPAVTVKPGRDLPGHHEEQSRESNQRLGIVAILHVSLTDNYLKSLTGSLIIITTTITKTTPKLQNCLSYLALVILLKTAAALCRMSKSRMERCVAEAPPFPSVPEPFLFPSVESFTALLI